MSALLPKDSKPAGVAVRRLGTMPADIRPPTTSPAAAEVYTGSSILTHDADLPGRLSACEPHKEATRDDSQIDMQRHSRQSIPTPAAATRAACAGLARIHLVMAPDVIGSFPASSQVESRLCRIS